MTETVIAKVATPFVITGVTALAALDPSVTNIVLALIAAAGNAAALHYGYKTAALNKKLAEKDALLAAYKASKPEADAETKEKEKLP